MFGQHKFSISQILWQIILVFAIAFSAIESSLSIAFHFPLKNWHIVIDCFLAFIFIIDFLYKLKLRKDRKKVSDFYEMKLYTTIIDLLACIPFDLISHLFGLGLGEIVFNIFRALKFIRVLKIYSFLIHLTIIPRFFKISFIIICSTVAIHWIACGWAFLNPTNIIDRYTAYNMSLYWAVTTLTTIGYGDITPSSNIGRLYTMIIMILGVGVYGIVIGNVTRVFSLADRYKEQTRVKMNELALYMRHYNIPIKLQNSVFGFYNHLSTKRLSDNDTKIIAELPHPLQIELQCYMNMKLISTLPVFKNCSHNCLKEIAQTLEQMYYSPGQRIIKIGEIGQEMYIIAHGKVEMLNDKKEALTTLQDGQLFGEVALLKEKERKIEVKATSYCDLYKLRKDDFLRIIKKYPELLSNLQKSMYKRSEDRKKS